MKNLLLKKTMVLILVALCSTMTIGQVAQSFTDLANGMTAPTQGTSPTINDFGNCTFYTTPIEFEDACGVLPVEDFEGSPVTSGGMISCSPIISSSTTNCFPPGTLIDGFSISTTAGVTASLGAGIAGSTSNTVGSDRFPENTIITFDANDVTAVAFDLYSAFGPGNIQVDIYDLSNNLVGSTVVLANNTAPYYFAMSVPNPISRIVLNDDVTGTVAEVIDNLSFGACAPIPTMGQWGLMILGLIMASLGLAFMYVSKRKEAIA